MNPKENQRSVVQGSQGNKHRGKKNSGWDVGESREGIVGEGKQSGDEEKREDEEKIEGAKNTFFCFDTTTKTKENQIDLLETYFVSVQKNIELVPKN